MTFCTSEFCLLCCKKYLNLIKAVIEILGCFHVVPNIYVADNLIFTMIDLTIHNDITKMIC